jgi:5-methylcytosine-specific restriction protein A
MNKPSGKHLQKKYGISAEHALYREDGKWYHHLKKFPGVLFDANGYLLFQTEAEYKNHPDLRIRKDLNVYSGISKLTGYRLFPLKIRPIQYASRNEEAVWKLRSIELRYRDQRKVEDLKTLYDYTCQLCGIRIPVGSSGYYIEVHHIKPLGKKHVGPDSVDNMICVCPNDHILLDLKVITLQLSTLKRLKHDIAQIFLDYHNSLVKG